MFLLLLVACMLYFVLSEPREGLLMLVAMIFVAAISVYQEVKSSKALEALKKYTEPKAKCKRDGKLVVIPVDELVPGDIILVEEGRLIPADAVIVQSNDFSVNESIVTGESFPVSKGERSENKLLYQGCTVNSGKCYARVTATGAGTLLARIGNTTAALGSTKTLLQRQIGNYVRAMTIFGLSASKKRVTFWLCAVSMNTLSGKLRCITPKARNTSKLPKCEPKRMLPLPLSISRCKISFR